MFLFWNNLPIFPIADRAIPGPDPVRRTRDHTLFLHSNASTAQ